MNGKPLSIVRIRHIEELNSMLYLSSKNREKTTMKGHSELIYRSLAYEPAVRKRMKTKYINVLSIRGNRY